jgi:rubredoxin
MSTEPNINNEKLNSSPNNSETEGSATTTDGEVIPQEETAQQKYRREKLAEIAEDKAKEVFVTRSTGRYECQACGYVYDETKGLPKKGVAPGTPIDDIDKFRCPQCGASKKYFVAETETLSGFKENLKFGIGTNALTAGQKSLLIYGGLLLGVAVFLSGYLLE